MSSRFEAGEHLVGWEAPYRISRYARGGGCTSSWQRRWIHAQRLAGAVIERLFRYGPSPVIKSDAFSSHTLEVKDTAELQIDFLIKNTSQYQHDMMSILSSLQMLTMVSPQRKAIRFTRIAKLCQKN